MPKVFTGALAMRAIGCLVALLVIDDYEGLSLQRGSARFAMMARIKPAGTKLVDCSGQLLHRQMRIFPPAFQICLGPVDQSQFWV